MIHKFLPCLAVILSSSLQLQAQSIPDTCSNDFRNWIRTIGSDEFGGRKPMTPYETKTIDYIAGEFRLLGLKPAFGDSYFQTVREISTTVHIPGDEIKVRTANGPVILSTPEDVMVWTTRAEDKVMFDDAGFYDKSLFRGRNMTYYGRWVYKMEQARKLGAAGCLIIHNEAAAGYGWRRLRQGSCLSKDARVQGNPAESEEHILNGCQI